MSRSRQVTSGALSLAVREWGHSGEGAGTVVLVHGYPDTSRVWDAVADILSARYHVVAYDVRGAGASDAPSSAADYRLELLVDDLAAVVAATSPDRAVHLVGHDWGSTASWEAVTTERMAGRIASFTSMSGPCLDHVGQWRRAMLRRPTPAHLRALARQGLMSWYVAAMRLPGAPRRARLAVGRSFAPFLRRVEGIEPTGAHPAATLAVDAANGVSLYRANVADRLRRPRPRVTDVPVQVVHPVGDTFVSARMVDAAEPNVTDLWRRDVPGRHWLLRRHPERVARWVDEFATAVSSGSEPRSLRKSRVGGGRLPMHDALVVVTGAGSGIGRSTALAFAEQGAEVVVVDVDPAGLARTAELAGLLGAHAHQRLVDVGDAGAMEDLAKGVLHDLGVPDVVVNNAGIGMAGGLLDTSVDDWEQVLHVNLWGVIHGSRLFGSAMTERGEGGQIVNVASAAAYTPGRSYPAYATTKAAVLMLTESLRAELAGDAVGVSAVCPGFARTGITTATRSVGTSAGEQDRRRRSADRLYARRNLTADQVAAAIVDTARRNRPVVPVGAEAKVALVASRLTPGIVRRIARVDIGRG